MLIGRCSTAKNLIHYLKLLKCNGIILKIALQACYKILSLEKVMISVYHDNRFNVVKKYI